MPFSPEQPKNNHGYFAGPDKSDSELFRLNHKS